MPYSAGELTTLFQHYMQQSAPTRKRLVRNTLATAGIDGGMFSQRDLEQLGSQGMSFDGYNLLLKYVKGVSGSFISNYFDPKFSPSSDSEISFNTARLLEEIYISDKDRNGYKISAMQTIWDGLICQGTEEIFIERPVMGDPRTWTIGFRPVRPDSIVFDPGNTANRISRNSTSCMRYNYYNRSQIEQMYPDKRPAVKEVLEKMMLEEMKTYDHDSDSRNAVLDWNEKHRNNRYQIVEYYYIEQVRVQTDLYLPEMINIPETEFKYGSAEDTAAKEMWAMKNGYTLKPEYVRKIDDVAPTLMVVVWCPELGIILDEGKDERQLNGHLPFYSWSYMEMNGNPIGLVDALWSSQEDINKREKAKTNWMESAPVQKLWYSNKLFGGSSDKARAFAAQGASASRVVEVDGGLAPGLAERYMGITPAPQMPNALNQDESSKFQLMDSISGLTAAMQGRTERSGESGEGFTRKVIEGAVNQKYPRAFLNQHEHDKATDWLMLVPYVYGSDANIGRTFSTPGKRDFITVNKPIGISAEGEYVLENDLSKVERVDVTIGKANESDFAKQAKRESDVQYLGVMTPDGTNAELRTVVQGNLALNMDFTSDEEKKNTEEAVQRANKLGRLRSLVEIRELEVRLAGADVQEAQAIAADSMVETNTEVQYFQADAAKKAAQVQSIQADQAIQQLSAPQMPQQPGAEQGPPQGAPQQQQEDPTLTVA